MDINRLLISIVCISCILQIFYATRSSARLVTGWTVASGFVLAITAVLSYLTPAIAGLIGGSLWAVLIVAPSFAMVHVNRLLTQHKFQQASKIAQIVRLLHPADGLREQPELIKGLEMAQKGLIDEATLIFQRYQSSTPIGRYATICLYQINSRWSELLIWLQLNTTKDILTKESYILLMYLRSLGEIGDVNGLLEAWQQFKLSIEKTNLGTRNLARMYVLAFCGEKEQVAKLFNDSLAIYPQTVKDFWLATAEQAAGNYEIARELLLNLTECEDRRIREAAQWRLSQKNMVPYERTPLFEGIVEQIITEIQQEAWYKGSIIKRQPKTTYLIIGFNLIAFALEIAFGGSTNLITLYNLGALVPQKVLAGEWWRLFTATFLHFGWLHLTMNMFGLYFFGRLVEFILGVQRYLFVYLVTGFGSMLTVTLMSVNGYSKSGFLVGASGAIMGLVGVSVAIFLRDWSRDKVAIASKNLRQFLLIILLQTVLDLTTPQISFIGHFSGTIIGFLLGMMVKHDWKVR
ncbi:rhomboid family protein [Calothrix sp. NIES-4071]|nr:rhomboid family protein [Calothrix sp. NIES-4071]BAZ55278.1 rhomboid family protein [Calothrix sp. NIES-4105]